MPPRYHLAYGSSHSSTVSNGSNHVTRSRPSRSQNARRARRRFRAARSPARRIAAAADSGAPRAASSRSCASSRPSRGEIVRELRQVLRPVGGHEHEVLEAHAAVALPVTPGLDRDDVAGDERASRRGPCPAARAPRARRRGRDAWKKPSVSGSPSALRPLRLLAGPLEDVARRRRRSARPSAPSLIADSARRAPPCRAGATRARRPAPRRRRTSASCRLKQKDSLSRGQTSITIGTPAWIGPEPMSWPIGPCRPVRDDEIVGGRAVADERLAHRNLHALDGQRLAVELEHPPPLTLARRSRSRAASIPASAAR